MQIIIGAASSGDIDILLTHPSYVSSSYVKEKIDTKESTLNIDKKNLIVHSEKSPKGLLEAVVNKLIEIEFICDTLANGDTKFMVKL